jgi:hypothetical protein
VAEFRVQTLLDTKPDTLSKIKNNDSVGDATTQQTATKAKITSTIEHQ